MARPFPVQDFRVVALRKRLLADERAADLRFLPVYRAGEAVVLGHVLLEEAGEPARRLAAVEAHEGVLEEPDDDGRQSEIALPLDVDVQHEAAAGHLAQAVAEPVRRYIQPAGEVLQKRRTAGDVADEVRILRREQDHLMKYLLGELGTAGKIDGTRAIFNGKFEWEHINNAIKNYTVDYVICSECGKPDTRLVKDGRIPMLRCDACGGHRPVRKRRARTEPVGTQLEEGDELEVEIHHLSKRGDGVAKVGKYTLYVAGTKPNQKVKVKITRIAGSIAFTEKV